MAREGRFGDVKTPFDYVPFIQGAKRAGMITNVILAALHSRSRIRSRRAPCRNAAGRLVSCQRRPDRDAG
jgi:hypothetical protein